MYVEPGINLSYQLEYIHLGLTSFSVPFLVPAPALKGQYNSNWAERDATPSLDASSNSDHKINLYELFSVYCSNWSELIFIFALFMQTSWRK